MKKVFLFIFAFIYLGLSSGFAFDIHFCMGKFSSIELFHANKSKCGKCGMNNGNDCCKTKVTVVKITDNQQIASTDIKILSPVIAPVQTYFDGAVAYKYLPSAKFTRVNSPPPIPGSFICILNSAFLI